MILQFCSDLHLEFPENWEFLKENPLAPQGSILILAGDVLPLAIRDRFTYFFDELSAQFDMVYWLPGNHEYYHADISICSGSYPEFIRKNILLLNNQTVYLDGIRLIFSTLWTRISPQNEALIEGSINDFRLIKFKGKLLSASGYNQLHRESLVFVGQELAKDFKGKTLLVSHHVPTLLHYPDKYARDRLNEAFAVELFSFIQHSGIDAWIYGHHHYNTEMFQIGDTALLTNQLGYVRCKEHLGFVPDKTVDF